MHAAETLPATEAADPRWQELDTWPPAAALQALWQAQLAAVAAVGPALPAIAAAVDASVPRLAAGGRLVYAGAGTSGRIAAQDGAELPPTFDWPRDRLVLLMAGGPTAFVGAVEDAEDDAGSAAQAVADSGVGPRDVVLAVAASGGTPFTCACLQAARERGALAVAVANSPGGRLLTLADHAILVATGPEPLAGSTRLQAGTAQKVVLNLFSTFLMVRLGRTYRGRMVDMRASNAKLRARAVRMLVELAGADAADAQAALAAAEGSVKRAMLVLRGADPLAAQALLLRSGGQLRSALAELGG